MISDVSYKSSWEQKQNLKISISNGIIDINQYEIAMNSTKNNKTNNQNTANLISDSKENNPSINFISSMINNKNLFGNQNEQDFNNKILEDIYNNKFYGDSNDYEKLVNIEKDKVSNLNIYNQNNKLVVEKNLVGSSCNFSSNQNEYACEGLGMHYNDASTDKQFTLEKQFNENYNNSFSKNQSDLIDYFKEDKRIKRDKSGVQPFVQLQKSKHYKNKCNK
jgi:hypothetical protein